MRTRLALTFLALTFSLSGCIFGGAGTDANTGTNGDPNNSFVDAGGTDAAVTDASGADDMTVVPPDMTVAPPNCGDGALQFDEKCDPEIPAASSGSCPRTPDDCDDDLACTRDAVTGSPLTCDAVCASEPIEACANDDGCCPADCTPDNDNDCVTADVCGDGMVTGGENCDVGIMTGDGVCPTRETCPAPMACERVIVEGENCGAACSYVDITVCVSDDDCCPAGCTIDRDNDCVAMCGNDIIEVGETCDGNCPADCDDLDVCTDDLLQGSAADCDAVCDNDPITACQGGDGCCPSTCDNSTDSDCSASCGDGNLDAGETCDPPGTCPTTCDDGDPSTRDVLSGSAANCNVTCTNTPITACSGATLDGYCPPACSANNDDDCVPTCGNEFVEDGESCDGNCPDSCNDGDACTADALNGSAATCDASCSNVDITSCIDGDGCCASGCNGNNDDDCGSVCGNGVVEPGETCDGNCPSTCNDGNACTNDVRTGSNSSCDVVCSNSTINSCIDGDGCCASGCNSNNDTDCSASCGNGVTESGETCDGDCPTSCDACETLSGSAGSCNVQCDRDTSCQTCDLAGTCECGSDELCDGGECVQTAGGPCNEACAPHTYCSSTAGSDYFCDMNSGECIECYDGDVAGNCGDTEYCSQSVCIQATSCDQANEPHIWCQQRSPSRPLCNANTAPPLCVECLSDNDCDSGLGETCDGGSCVILATPCQSNSNCEPTEACMTGLCVPAPSCGTARDGSVWCQDNKPGTDLCLDDTCWQSCAGGPSAACNCPDPRSQGCKPYQGNTSNPFVCQDAQFTNSCVEICPTGTYRDDWCDLNGYTVCNASNTCIVD